MQLSDFLKMFGMNESKILTIYTESEALEAVKHNGDALRYVKEQSEAVCIEAVKNYGGALQYVDKRIFVSVQIKNENQ